MSGSYPLARLAALAAALWLGPAWAAPSLAGARGAPEPASAVLLLLAEARVDEAAAQLAQAPPGDGPVRRLAEGSVRFHRGDYAGAIAPLEEAARSGGPLGEEAAELLSLARGTTEVTRGYEVARGAHFEIYHAPGKDAVLVPYALDALERAYGALGEDFADRPTSPVRVEIYPSVATLARVSTLTEREIETSGTIALCKYNRLMIVSPRALVTGYPWLDTLTHEYTHFIVTRVSHDTVPIWLHEGLAKFEERRWRGPGGGGLSPVMEHLLAAALRQRRLVPFARMHPSMAKLPSQEEAALAFAEVYMAVEYLREEVGWAGLRRILDAMRGGADHERAVGEALGRPFAQFERDLRAFIAQRKPRERPELVPQALRFERPADAGQGAAKDRGRAEPPPDASEIKEGRARDHARLGGMLRARGRLVAAAREYEKAQAIVGPGHPLVGTRLARTYLEAGDPARAAQAAEATLANYPEQAGAEAVLGAARLAQGDGARAIPHLESAVAVSPFDPAPHCGLARAYREAKDARAPREDEACRTLSGR